MRRVVPVLVVLVMGCEDDRLRRPTPMEPTASCGDGIIQSGEDCDASALGDATCESLGFDTGRVICNAECRYDTALCVKRCGNGVLDFGETCDGALGVPECTTWGFNACSEACQIDTRRCVATAPFEAGPELVVAKGGRAVLGDVSPISRGALVMVVPDFARVEIFPWNMTRGFEATNSRKLSFQRTPWAVELLDANGDGATDVATLNSGGSADLLVGGSAFTLVTLDAGVDAAAGFVPSNGVIRREAAVAGSNTVQFLSLDGVRTLPTPSRRASAWGPHGLVWADDTTLHFTDGGTFAVPSEPFHIGPADFDGDGDEDLAVITSAGTQLYENTGAGFAPRVTWSTNSASQLRVVDFDQDGRPDVFWTHLDGVTVRRNDGAFNFTETVVPETGGPRWPPTIGDADGDGDLDLAFPYFSPDGTHTVKLWLNRVR